MDPERVSDDTFLLDCVRASVAPGLRCKAAAEDAEEARSILAPELERNCCWRRIFVTPWCYESSSDY